MGPNVGLAQCIANVISELLGTSPPRCTQPPRYWISEVSTSGCWSGVFPGRTDLFLPVFKNSWHLFFT